jgi:large subunit ribosomal protein LP2
MKYVAAYLLAQLGASAAEAAPSSKADVQHILESVGVTVKEDRLDLVFRELEGKELAQLSAVGRERLARRHESKMCHGLF